MLALDDPSRGLDHARAHRDSPQHGSLATITEPLCLPAGIRKPVRRPTASHPLSDLLRRRLLSKEPGPDLFLREVKDVIDGFQKTSLRQSANCVSHLSGVQRQHYNAF